MSQANSNQGMLDRLRQLFLETGAFLATKEPSFLLSSGVLSRFYVDCRIVLSHAEARELVGELILEQVDLSELDAVGGLALGAYPVAMAVSDAAYRRAGLDLRAFVIRKEPKQHGLKKHIEGHVKAGDRVLVVEDAITSGASTIEAIRRSREAGLIVAHAVTIIDREESDGAKNIAGEGVTLHHLLTLRDLDREPATKR